MADTAQTPKHRSFSLCFRDLLGNLHNCLTANSAKLVGQLRRRETVTATQTCMSSEMAALSGVAGALEGVLQRVQVKTRDYQIQL